MIDEIQVENLALIREATLVPARGLTVLTGETGAGKTALLSALKLLMGARADKDAVRDGEEALSVSGGSTAPSFPALRLPTILRAGLPLTRLKAGRRTTAFPSSWSPCAA